MKVNNYLNNKIVTYHIKSIAEDGKTIIVDTEQDIFNKKNKKEYNKIVNKYIKDYLQGKYAFNKNKMIINKITANKYAYARINHQKLEIKMRLSTELPNIIQVAKKRGEALPYKEKSKFSKYEYYGFNFVIDNNKYNAILHVGTNKLNEKIVYEINKIKNIEDENTHSSINTVNKKIVEYKSYTRILDLPVNERPRERLIHYGVENLSNEELLAIILRTGTKDISAKGLASNVLKKLSNIRDLNDLNYETLISIKGVGPAKACDLLTTIELGKRLNQKRDTLVKVIMKNPVIIFEYYKDRLNELKQEHFYTVYLDTNKRIIKEKLLFIGTINQSLVDPINIFKEAFLLNSKMIICIHNHPSNTLFPSKEDLILTKKLKNMSEMLDIILLDHIIIGKDNYYSFLENNDL